MPFDLSNTPDSLRLEPGKHVVKIVDYYLKTMDSGAECCEYTVVTRSKLKGRCTIWFRGKEGAKSEFGMVQLKRLAKACGLTAAQMAKFDWPHLKEKVFTAHVREDNRNPQYTEVYDFSPADSPSAAPPQEEDTSFDPTEFESKPTEPANDDDLSF